MIKKSNLFVELTAKLSRKLCLVIPSSPSIAVNADGSEAPRERQSFAANGNECLKAGGSIAHIGWSWSQIRTRSAASKTKQTAILSRIVALGKSHA